MASVLVLGATGSIGFPVALAFRRSGYKVFGTTRNHSKSHRLEKFEIHPVICDLKDISSWRTYAEKASVVVDCSAEYEAPEPFYEAILQTLLEISKTRTLTYIFTSGGWVYGNNLDVVDESFNAASVAPPRVQWRVKFEHKVLAAASPHFYPVVVRPSNVYGHDGSLTAMWFGPASQTEGELVVPGHADIRYNFVHVDDLGDGYLRAAENAPIVKGQIFNFVGDFTERLGDALDAVIRVSGFKGQLKYKAPENTFEECLTLDSRFTNKKAKALLGWQPKHLGFVVDAEESFLAWKARQKHHHK